MESLETSSGEPPEQAGKTEFWKELDTQVPIYLLLPGSCLQSLPTESRRSQKGWQGPFFAGAWESVEPFGQNGFHVTPHQRPGSLCAGCTINTHRRQCFSLNHCRIATPREFQQVFMSPSELTKKKNPPGGPTATKGILTRAKSHAQQRMLKKEEKPMGRKQGERQRFACSTQKTSWS